MTEEKTECAAIEDYKQQLKIAKESRDRTKEKQAYCNLGNAYHEIGCCQRAIEYHNEHLNLAKVTMVIDMEKAAPVPTLETLFITSDTLMKRWIFIAEI